MFYNCYEKQTLSYTIIIRWFSDEETDIIINKFHMLIFWWEQTVFSVRYELDHYICNNATWLCVSLFRKSRSVKKEQCFYCRPSIFLTNRYRSQTYSYHYQISSYSPLMYYHHDLVIWGKNYHKTLHTTSNKLRVSQIKVGRTKLSH